jgi:hypothetical protein
MRVRELRGQSLDLVKCTPPKSLMKPSMKKSSMILISKKEQLSRSSFKMTLRISWMKKTQRQKASCWDSGMEITQANVMDMMLGTHASNI